jgi:hypothetical protein
MRILVDRRPRRAGRARSIARGTVLRPAARLLLIGAALVGPGPRLARATLCTVDNVPAATLLLPYFEVDLSRPPIRSTLMSITNASATATLAHVVLWTDYAVPTLAFDVYLTGYDVQTINLRDVFNGALPATADQARDPDDTISPKGLFSRDATFPGCAGLLPPPPLPAIALYGLRRAHQGLSLPGPDGLCSGHAFGDGLLRGYVTVDQTTQCSTLVPGDPGYFGPGGVAGFANVLLGDFFYVDSVPGPGPGQIPIAAGFHMVRIEADPTRFGPGSRTFYRTLVNGSGADGREPLPTRWSHRYFNGGAFGGGSDLIVWRDLETRGAPLPCGTSPAAIPLPQTAILAFDEQEHPSETPTVCGFPPCPPLAPPLPLAANHLAMRAGGAALPLPFSFGWILFDLDTGFHSPSTSQAWAGVILSANGGFQLGFDGMPLDSGCAPGQPQFPFSF